MPCPTICIVAPAQELVGGMYYYGCEARWERGNNPELEHEQHKDCPAPDVC